MLPDERRNFIYSHLFQFASVTIGELAKLLDVSHMTIRRDIQFMEREGEVTVISGGVKLNEALKQELPYVEKALLHHRSKRHIGAVAEILVESGQVIYLDAGTTTYEIARCIAAKLKKVTIITNDFTISDFLMKMPLVNLFHTGGQVDIRNRSCVGNSAAQFIRGLNIDVAFISTSSWDIEHGLSTPDEGKAQVKQAVLASARRNILVTDSSKYGKYGMFHICPLTQLTDIIYDDQLPDEIENRLRQLPIRLHKAIS